MIPCLPEFREEAWKFWERMQGTWMLYISQSFFAKHMSSDWHTSKRYQSSQTVYRLMDMRLQSEKAEVPTIGYLPEYARRKDWIF